MTFKKCIGNVLAIKLRSKLGMTLEEFPGLF